jgi:dTDP-4-amino-4,6-dideoxygalactose transaminase
MMPITIPWFDSTRQYQTLLPSLLPLVDEWMAKNSSLDLAVERFEEEFAGFVGARHCITMSSGASALHVALVASGIGPGDEVIVSPAAGHAGCRAITCVGARPVFVDIEPATHCINPALIEEAITRRTKAILPAHLYGQPADMPAINPIAHKHRLTVIEDASQAHAATLDGKHAGTFGHIGCFSFSPGTNLNGHGEGGALITDDDALARRVRQLRDCAPICPPGHTGVGCHMRMERLPAAMLSVKLPYLQRWTARRRQIARQYAAGLAELPSVQLPVERPGSRHNWHVYALCAQQRDLLRDHLAAEGIRTSVHYPTPLHLQPTYRHLGHGPGDFPAVEQLCRSQVSLPIFPELTDEEVSRIIHAVSAWEEIEEEARVAA